jgi:hypothetical protein
MFAYLFQKLCNLLERAAAVTKSRNRLGAPTGAVPPEIQEKRA